MKRLFLALKAHIGCYDMLKSEFADVLSGRWTRDENLHMTLCYFGNAYEADEIIAKVPDKINILKGYTLSSMGYFHHNNILYARPDNSGAELLHSLLCSPFALKEASPFIPHVTLMRIKNITDKKRFEELLEAHKEMEIGSIEPVLRLMQSVNTPDGVRYVCIKEF